MVKTARELAKRLRRSTKTVSGYVRRDDWPHDISRTGPWSEADVKRLIVWKDQLQPDRSQAIAGSVEDKSELALARRRLLQAQIALRTHRNSMLKGDWCREPAYLSLYGQAAERCKATLRLTLPLCVLRNQGKSYGEALDQFTETIKAAIDQLEADYRELPGQCRAAGDPRDYIGAEEKVHRGKGRRVPGGTAAAEA